MLLDELLQWDAHLFFDIARIVYVAGDRENLGAGVVFASEPGKPGRAPAQNGRHDSDRFHIVDRCRAAIEATRGRKWRLETRLALFTFKAFEQRGFFAADIGAGPTVQIDIKVPA